MKRLVFISVLLASAVCLNTVQAAATCDAESSWVTSPNPPSAIPSTTNVDCGFHQFSWQWFLQLMSPIKAGVSPLVRNFENSVEYPLLTTDSIPAACEVSSGIGIMEPHKAMLVGGKNKNDDVTMTFPEKIGQAGPGDLLYDQKGNIVFYSRRYTRNMCGLTKHSNFDAATVTPPTTPASLVSPVTELKLAWRQIGGLTLKEQATYYSIEGDITDVGTIKLGLVGFHIVKNTPKHPEFIWATFVHKNNAPNCTNPQATPASGWSFLSTKCADCLKTKTVTECQKTISACKDINVGSNVGTSLTGTPSLVCDAHTNGGGSSDNLAAIQALNTSMEEVWASLNTNGKMPADMAVFENYTFVGSEWVKNIKKPSGGGNDAGSVKLANNTLESFTQVISGEEDCFGCHGYEPATTAHISHLLPSSCDRQAGPIWNQADAETKCPTVCGTGVNDGWNGQWTTTQWGVMSVCGCNTCSDE